MMKLRTKDLVTAGMMVAVLEAAKTVLMILPNVELVSFFIVVFTLFFGAKILYVIGAFVLLEGILHGFGIWWIMYLYAWPLLALVTLLLRRKEEKWVFAAVSGIFGLMFGALCSLPYFFIGGWSMGFSWWVAGIPYDLIHGVSNFLVCMVLFTPVRRILNTVARVHIRE